MKFVELTSVSSKSKFSVAVDVIEYFGLLAYGSGTFVGIKGGEHYTVTESYEEVKRLIELTNI